VQYGEECDDGNRGNFDECPNDCLISVCGDGVKEGLEYCDDGNQIEDDLCPTTCSNSVCGNGAKEHNEQCDDGNTENGDGCSAKCKSELACGNGILDVGEECDNGASNSDTRSDACRITCINAFCGDGVIDSDEECDGGEDCTDSCSQKILSSFSHNDAFGATLFLFGSLSIIGYLLRKRIADLFHIAAKNQAQAPSLDDIPLDELEMPWHKWNQ
jgi:cysteine-rich repeat protein